MSHLARLPYPVLAQRQELAEREVAAASRRDRVQCIDRFYDIGDGSLSSGVQGIQQPLEGL